MRRLSIFFACLVGTVGCGSSNSSTGAPPPGAAGSGGSGGSAGAGGAGSGGGGAAGMLGEPQWLSYVASEGSFAYDAATYPATDSLPLGAAPTGLNADGTPPAWAPDGTHVAYIAGDALEVREVSTHTLGAPVTLASGLTPNSGYAQNFWWSNDSKALAYVSGSSLYVVDPSAATPAPKLVTSNDYLRYQWAPAGNGLLYSGADGLYFVHVNAGTPDTPQKLVSIGNSWGWSPDASKVVFENGLDIVYFDMSGASVASTPVVTRTAATYYADPALDFDGSLFAFNADEGIYYAASGAPSAITLLSSPAPSGKPTQGIGWHPKQPVMLFTVVDTPTTQSGLWYYVKFTGSTPSAPVAIPGSWQYLTWLPDKLALIATDLGTGQLSYVDLSGAAPVATPYETQPGRANAPSWAPGGDTLAFNTTQAVILASLSDPSAPTHSVSSMLGAISWQGWSNNGQYLAILSKGLEVVRIDGTTPSLVKTLHPSATSLLNFSWQP